MKKNIRQKRLVWTAGIIALAAILFFALISIQEKHNADLGLPAFSMPKADDLKNLFDNAMPENAKTNATAPDTGVQVHFIDVGQGKSVLIKGPEKNVLIDAGESDQGVRVLRYLSTNDVKSLDAVIGTHPHSDHIGGLSAVIDDIDVGSVVLPVLPDELVPTTATYRRFLESIAQADLKITPAKPGESFDLGGGAELVILGPLAGHKYKDLNNYSVVCRLDYGKTSFLFTGDLSAESEHDILNAEENLRASVLDAGHHGSKTATTKNFLDAVNPGIAVISCGIDNKYGHPHREVIDRLKNRDITILRTDLNGSAVIYSDGESLGIETEKGSES